MSTKEISSIKTVNPFNNETVKEFQPMSKEKIASIIDKADEAFTSWRKTSVKDRAAIMAKIAALLLEKKAKTNRKLLL